MPHDVTLKVAGQLYGGWKDISIARGIEQIAGTFDLSVTERWSGQNTPRPIKPGAACEVAIDGQAVITGYVDDVHLSYDAETHTVSVSGRDKTGDLVDCSAIHGGGQWAKRTLAQIAGDICKPFGISVIDNAAAATVFGSYTVQESETAFECIERAARMRAVLLMSDGLGNLIITRAGKSRLGTQLVKGENILKATGEFSWRDRFSRYTVKGQAQGSDAGWADTVAQQKGVVTDASINRYRPLIVIAEDQGYAATFKQRAEWERNVRAGRGATAVVTVQGWVHGGGLWQPNTLVRIEDDFLSLNEDLLISAVAFSLSDSGTTTDLTLTGPQVFDLLPENPKGVGYLNWQ